MNLKRWTIDERMCLPDYCFGQRQMVMAANGLTGPNAMTWDISEKALPANICIWQIGVLPRAYDSASSYFRLGLLAEKATSQAEMDLAVPILEYWGWTLFSPPRIFVPATGTVPWEFFIRRGMATGGLRLAIEMFAKVAVFSLVVYMVYSELPKNISGFLAHSFLSKVR